MIFPTRCGSVRLGDSCSPQSRPEKEKNERGRRERKKSEKRKEEEEEEEEAALPARGRDWSPRARESPHRRRTAARGIPCISSRRAAVAETLSHSHNHSHSRQGVVPPNVSLSSPHPPSSTHDTPLPACFRNTVQTPRHIYIHSPGTLPARPLPSTPFSGGCLCLRHPISV